MLTNLSIIGTANNINGFDENKILLLTLSEA
jgi:hypothetical protein